MKTKILLFGLILSISLSASSKSFLIKDSTDFDSAFFLTGFDSDILLLMAKHSKTNNNNDTSILDLNNEEFGSLRNNIIHQRANWLSAALDAIGAGFEAFARLWQPVWGKYDEWAASHCMSSN
ncbi:MAG: hypothetical protein WCJ80_14570 [Bacteroidota bacterium]